MTRIRVKEQGSVVYNESRTFSKKVSATEWGKRKILEIEQGGYGYEAAQISVRELIYKYINDPHVELGRTKRNVLELLMSCNIATEDATNLKPHHIVDHCKVRNEGGAGPATVSHDISYLRAVFRSAKPMCGYNVDEKPFLETLPTLHTFKLVGKGMRRTRRPTADELDKLRSGLVDRMEHRIATIPYVPNPQIDPRYHLEAH